MLIAYSIVSIAIGAFLLNRIVVGEGMTLMLLVAGSDSCSVPSALLCSSTSPSGRRRTGAPRCVASSRTQRVRRPPRAPIEKRPGLCETVVPLLSRVALRLTPGCSRDQLEDRASPAAGIKRLNAQQFLALKTVLGVLGLVLGFGIGGVCVRRVRLRVAARRVRACSCPTGSSCG